MQCMLKEGLKERLRFILPGSIEEAQDLYLHCQKGSLNQHASQKLLDNIS